MTNIVTAHVSVRGTRALLWHSFGPDALPLEKQEKTGVAGNDPEEWRKTVLMTADRQLYVKHTYVFGCVRDAAKHTKRGRGTLQRFVAATLQVSPNTILVNRTVPPDDELTTDETAPVYLDIQGVRNPTTRARNVRYRIAAAPGWECSFDLEFDKTIVSRNEMEAVLIDAGRLVGLGDGRSIGYGRFETIAFEVEE